VIETLTPEEASMAEYLHKISELRNRFQYDPETGWMHWRDLPFIEWARGHGQAKQGHYMRWRREKANKRVKFSYTTPTSVARLRYRSVSYTGPRLAWALYHGAHPEDDEKIVTLNGDPRDLAIKNLGKMSDRDFYLQTRDRVRQNRKCEYRAPQPSWYSPQKLRRWFDYNSHTGDLYWQDMGWKEWRSFHRSDRFGPEQYEEYMYNLADTLVEFRKDRRGDQVINLKNCVYERKLLSYALKEGNHIPDICYLYHRDGDETNFRWENIGMTYRDDIDPDAD
jgi:hypothetical protein